MFLKAPLQISVEISFINGPAANQRYFRLSREIELPPQLIFTKGFPFEGSYEGRVRFQLPDMPFIESIALLTYHPEKLTRGCTATLITPSPQTVTTIQRYIDDRSRR